MRSGLKMAVAHQVPEDLPEDVKDKLAELDLELSEGQSRTFMTYS